MPSQNVTRFIASFMAAIDGCGALTQSSYDPGTRLLHVTHMDGCEIDVPDEVLAAMTSDQIRAAFAYNGGHLPTMAARREEVAEPPAPVVDYVVNIAQDIARRNLTRNTRVDTAIDTSRFFGQLSPTQTRNLTERNIRDRGQRFINLLSGVSGITLPTEAAYAVGKINQHLYGEIENQTFRASQRLERLREDYRANTASYEAAVIQHKVRAEKAMEAASKLERLRDAAIAWREASTAEGSPVEKFEKFNALMNAIDAAPEQANIPDVTAEMPPAELSIPAEEEETPALQPF